MIYAAFLRGINVGGNHKVPMAELKKVLEGLGFENVRTLLNSGNAVFETAGAGEEGKAALEKKMAAELERAFGFPIPVLLRPQEELAAMVKAQPFGGVEVTASTRLYVTLLPVATEGKTAVFTVLNVEDEGSTELMKSLEKKYGKNITTRNWNTIVKLSGLE